MSDPQEYKRLRTLAIVELAKARDLLERDAFWSALEKMKDVTKVLEKIQKTLEEA